MENNDKVYVSDEKMLKKKTERETGKDLEEMINEETKKSNPLGLVGGIGKKNNNINITNSNNDSSISTDPTNNNTYESDKGLAEKISEHNKESDNGKKFEKWKAEQDDG